MSPAPHAESQKLLLLTRYDRRAASTRFRCLQYLPYFAAAGFSCDVSSLLTDRYLDAKLDRGRIDVGAVITGYTRRMRELRGAGGYDAMVLYHEALPYVPERVEHWLTSRGVPYIYDFDDAYFHFYDLHPRWFVRAALGRKIARVIAGATLVMAGNEYLAGYARRFNRRVEIVPTVVDTTRFVPAPRTDENAEVVIGWIGSPSTASYIQNLTDVWRRVIEPGRTRLTLVGSGPVDLGSIPVTIVPWREEEEIAAVQSFDIGIMPLRDDPWSRGKCGFKLIEYMACGVPVVASPVGVNSRIVQQGSNGYLCATTDEWTAALRRLIDDTAARRRLGERARADAVADWSLARWSGTVVGHLNELTSGK